MSCLIIMISPIKKKLKQYTEIVLKIFLLLTFVVYFVWGRNSEHISSDKPKYTYGHKINIVFDNNFIVTTVTISNNKFPGEIVHVLFQNARLTNKLEWY